MVKFETHLHTTENDIVVRIPTDETVRLYHEAGYDGIVVTNHYFSLFFDWFADELRGKTKDQVIDRWLSGYRSAKKAGDALGMTVLPGAEVRFDGSINDYLLYGVDEEFFYRAPYLNRLKNVKELTAILPADALIYAAHPFRDNMTINNPSDIYGVEVWNGGTEPFRNRLAAEYAEHYGKAVISGSDFHCREHLAKGGVIFKDRPETPGELYKALAVKNYDLIEN